MTAHWIVSQLWYVAAVAAICFVGYRWACWELSEREYMRRVRERCLRTPEDIAWSRREQEARLAEWLSVVRVSKRLNVAFKRLAKTTDQANEAWSVRR